MPAYTQWCSATDGRTRQHRVMDDSLLPFTSLRENLTQTHLDFSYFRTTEPKLLRLCARCHSQTYETPFRWATHASTNHHLFSNSPNNLFINIHFFPKHYNCIFDISCYTTSIAIRFYFHRIIFWIPLFFIPAFRQLFQKTIVKIT